MDELMKEIENNIKTLGLIIKREKNDGKFNYASEVRRFLRLTELCMSLEKWEAIHKLLVKYKNTRCRPIEKKSDLFVRIIEVEKNGVPGFVSVKTRESMIDYMKQLEWKIDELNGIWNSRF